MSGKHWHHTDSHNNIPLINPASLKNRDLTQVKRRKMTDQVFNINDIFDKIKDGASPLRGTLENEISNEVNEIKSLRYFEVPK